MLFSLRNPSIALTPVVTLLLSYPFGVGWAYGTYLDIFYPTREIFQFANLFISDAKEKVQDIWLYLDTQQWTFQSKGAHLDCDHGKCFIWRYLRLFD